LITHVDDPDEGRDGRRDDDLVALLRPGGVLLAPQPGAFESIRRGAARRRRRRAAAGGTLVLAVAAAIAAPLYLTGVPPRTTPRVPLAPPSLSSTPATTPTPSSPGPTQRPSAGPRTPMPTDTVAPSSRATAAPVRIPSPSGTALPPQPQVGHGPTGTRGSLSPSAPAATPSH
jgi:hypothetical protein